MCSDSYTPSLGSTCSKCPQTSGLGIGLLVAFGVVAFVVCVAILNYMLSGQERSADRGIMARISRFIPFQSLKIIVVVWQILTQVEKVPVRCIIWFRTDATHVHAVS